MKNITTIIDRIIFLPQSFRTRGDKSFYNLLESSRYFDFYEDVTESGICERLREYPVCCDSWMEWSEDRRSDSGWYVRRENENSYVVGYHGECSKIVPKYFIDKTQAVASFIKNQIENMRSLFVDNQSQIL
jgi:hypothetical protein